MLQKELAVISLSPLQLSAQSSREENFFQKKYTHAEASVIQELPRVIYTIILSKISNLRRKTTKTPKIRHYYII